MYIQWGNFENSSPGEEDGRNRIGDKLCQRGAGVVAGGLHQHFMNISPFRMSK